MKFVDMVCVSPDRITLEEGSWFYGAKAEVFPSEANYNTVTWHSEKPSVASVDPSTGYIYANSVGSAKIYATAADGSGCRDYITVTVRKTATNTSSAPMAVAMATAAENSSDPNVVLATSVTVSPAQKRLIVNQSTFLHATVCPCDVSNCCVTWSSSNPMVASVNPHSGLVCAKTAGTTTISATAVDGSGKKGQCTVTVIDRVYMKKICFDDAFVSLDTGERYKPAVTICPSDTSTMTLRWSSDNPSVAEVNYYTGRVTAISVGDALITATAQDGSKVTGTYRVRVKQTAIEPQPEPPAANTTVLETTVADPVDAYTGAHLLQNNLLSLFGGMGLNLTLHYDSTKLSCGLFGKGWYHNFEKSICVCNSEAYVYETPSVYSRYTSCAEYYTEFTCCSPNKEGYLLTVDYSREYPYMLDCNSERTEWYDNLGRLVKIVDHQGFETTFTYTDSLITITDAVSGKHIYLQKNHNCHVIRVYDDIGREANITYENGMLRTICDVNDNTLTYTYDDKGRVLTGTDSEGICYFDNIYDEYGRVMSQKDAIAGTPRSTFVYNDRQRVTTNRCGKESIREYDCNGLLIRYTDENGHVKTYAYDDRYNITRETDAEGHSVLKSYNRFNKPTMITDKNGNTTYFTYDAVGNVTKIRYPAVNGVFPEETFVYNSRNQMTQHTDIRGTVTLYTYDENGMPATKKVGDKTPIVYSYEAGLLKSQTDAMGNTTSYAHNTIGQVISKTDAENKVTEYAYDMSGNLLRMTDACGKTVVNTYDGNYQKTSVTDANGNTTEYSYNGNMKNDLVTLPDGHTIRYEFDGEDRTVKVIDQLSNATNVTYDDAGRVLSKRLPDGALVQYEYDKVGHVVKETNPKGAAVTKTYDGLGNVLTVTDHEDNTTSYEYNAMSKVVKVTSATGGTTVYTYSAAGDLLSETDALGNTKTYTYDAFGNRLTATDAKNNVTTYTYDQNNNLLTVKDALNHVTTYTYNALNQCVSVKDALNNVIRYGYDALGRRTTITDARGNVFTTTYDGNGNVLKTTDAKGNTVSETVYNCLNLPLTVTDAMGKATTYTYNAQGKVESVTNSLGHRSEYSYNARGQNTSVRDAANGISTATYDLLGNITRLAGPLGGATNYTYDNMGRLTSESTVSGGTKAYEYNELNIREKITNARGQVRQLFHDVLGRVTGYTSPEGTVSYTYDANGNVLTVTDSHGTITRTYDALNRVSSYTDTYGKVIRYEYDAVGNLSKIIYPDDTAVTYAYDANHNLVRVTDWANRVTTYTYDENNRVTGSVKPDGSVTATAYDNKQRVTSTVERTAGGTVITGFEYTYDDLSRIIEEKVLANNTVLCYTYDSLNRVTARTVKNATTHEILSAETFNYDAAGNVTSAPDSSFQYDTNNRLISFNGNTVSYDLDGNMLSNGTLTCTYDSANRLVSAGGHTYTYNAEDVRIRNLCAEEDTTYTYNTNAKLSMLLMKTTNGVVTKYVYGKGLIGEELSGAFKTYHFDCRGSTIAITDASGNITDTFAYDTYGKLISRTGTSNVIFGYNGRDGVVTEDNELIYMRARYYSPEMKRFVNADIVPGQISNAITLNRFAYANGNPVSFVDPFGLSADNRGSNAKTTISCKQAVLVTRFDHEGLKVVGHTQLYFNCDGKWYLAEFTSREGSTLKQIKGNAKVYWEPRNPPVLNDSGQFQDVEGSNYVVLDGNFEESVKLAKQYAGQDPNGDNKEFGRYNFLFHNCADYTNELLDVANIDGMSSQVLSEGNTLITIPVLQEFKLSISDAVDSGIEWASDGLVDLGNSMKGSNIVGDFVGSALVGTGNFIDGATNFVGDATDVVTGVAGEFVDVGKDVAAGVTNTIVDVGTALYKGGKYLWNKLFG